MKTDEYPYKFTIDLDLSNDAFQQDATYEIARILRKLILKMEETQRGNHNLQDINGNTVGKSYVTY